MNRYVICSALILIAALTVSAQQNTIHNRNSKAPRSEREYRQRMKSVLAQKVQSEAIPLFKKGQYEEALGLFRKGAEIGETQSLYHMALMYHQGLGVKQNYQTARVYWSRLSTGLQPIGYYMLGMYAENGYSQEKDIKQAIKFYELAVKNGGYAEAQRALGSIYFSGRGEIKKDYELAFEWYMKAAKQANPRACYNVGMFYEKGFLGEPEHGEAIKWYSQAASKGNSRAMMALGRLYSEEDANKAKEYYLSAATAGESEAYFYLGNLYRNSSSEDDIVNAFAMFGKAAETGNEQAMTAIGEMYEFGEGVEKDVETAARWYAMAAEMGYEVAQYRLACLLYEGKGVETNKKRAIELMRDAAASGHAQSREFLEKLK